MGAVRIALAGVLCAAGAVVLGFILGEYEFSLWIGLVAGLVVGFLLAELALGVAGERDWVVAGVIAVIAAGALLWAGRVDSDGGVEPYPVTAVLGAVLAAAVALWRLRPVRARG